MDYDWFFIIVVLYMTARLCTAAPTNTTWSTPHLNLTMEKRGSVVPFGAVIDRCTVPGTIALTFDDGPFIYTPKILDILKANGARATFFLNGQGLGNIYAHADLVQRAIAEGHQLGSHTWGHPSLVALDYNAIVAQMIQLESAFSQIIGSFPFYMRAPYLFVNGLVLQAMADLGYHVIGASIDTKDYENDHPDLINNSFMKFRNELSAGGDIVLAHDVHQQTVDTLVQAMLNEVYARGLQPVTVGECLGDPRGEWYRDGPRINMAP